MYEAHSNSKGPRPSLEAASNPFSYPKSDHFAPSSVRETRAVTAPQARSPHSGQTSRATRCPPTGTSEVDIAAVLLLIRRATSRSNCGFERDPQISYLKA